jgi:hypothetical protein
VHRHQPNGVAYYTFESLEPFAELAHGITTRHGGVSEGRYATLNLSRTLGDDPAAVETNVQRTSAAIGVSRQTLVSPRQRHTAMVRRVDTATPGQSLDYTDALITDRPGIAFLLVFADCTPVLIYDPVRRALAVAHSGWRGTTQGMAAAAVAALTAEFGSRPADLIATVGPSIGPCCYEVGEDVTSAVAARFTRPDELLPTRGRNGRRHFDLWAANRRLLAEAGVRHIEIAGLCTACRTDEFYSFRAEQGHTGHFGAVMGLRNESGEQTSRQGNTVDHSSASTCLALAQVQAKGTGEEGDKEEAP